MCRFIDRDSTRRYHDLKKGDFITAICVHWSGVDNDNLCSVERLSVYKSKIWVWMHVSAWCALKINSFKTPPPSGNYIIIQITLLYPVKRVFAFNLMHLVLNSSALWKMTWRELKDGVKRTYLERKRHFKMLKCGLKMSERGVDIKNIKSLALRWLKHHISFKPPIWLA